MNKVLPLSSASLPLFGLASSRAIETAALAALPDPAALMERAGLAVARLALALQPREGTIWIACGPGNNGGDGRIAARLLHARGRHVHVGLDAPPDVALAIDALLGLGLNRPPSEAMAAAIARLNTVDAPVLSVDLPSGLMADTGALAGVEAVSADHTLSLLTLKPGLFTAQGRALAGTIWFDDLGIAPQPVPDAVLLGRGCIAGLDSRNHASHKGTQGDVLVVGGAPGMRGAALLAARAALAAGAGRVYAFLIERGSDTVDPGRPELMLSRQCDEAAIAGKTIVAGCGGGRDIAAHLPLLLRHAQHLVLDADALNAIAADPSLRQLLQRRNELSVLTPHPLEAARLLGCSTAEVQADRLGAAQALAGQLRSTVVLKGSGSIIATPEHLPAINSSGSAALATAGTGDVLAGWIGGLWAQNAEADPHAIACAATYWHGLAGEQQGAGPLRAADLVERMHALHRA